MIALDAYALVAFLADEPARAEVEEMLREQCVVSTVNLAESLDVLGRVHEIGEDELRGLVDPLLAEAIDVHPPGPEEAWLASSLRTHHYARSSRELSLADCFLLATASRLGGAVATSDTAVAATARAESLELVGLPDIAGRRP